jgi:RimJ/RimL family protein N-acetyltransferase
MSRSEPWHRTDGVVNLTRFVRSDAVVLCEADGDDEHRRRFEIPPDFVPSLAHSEGVIARWEREFDLGQRFPFALRSVVTGELLGGCELRPLTEGTANLSYWTYPDHRRRGIALRAVALVSDVAFVDFGVRRLEILTHADNLSSRRVAERSGFREVGRRGAQVLYVAAVRPLGAHLHAVQRFQADASSTVPRRNDQCMPCNDSGQSHP